ncbi:MAG: DM13 domain-containing protein [Bacteroidota bacterium]
MRLLPLLSLLFLFTACIGDDIVEDYVSPVIRFENPVSSIEAGTSYQFEAQFINNVGQMEDVRPTWTSANPDLLAIDANGLATAITEGNTVVTAAYEDEFGEMASTSLDVEIGASTVVVEEMSRSGSVATTTFYDLEGDFVLSENAMGGLTLAFSENYNADTGLPGLYVYLSNNPNSSAQAFEIGRVSIFQGAHQYEIENVALNDYQYVLYYCKPFNVKVGHGDIE